MKKLMLIVGLSAALVIPTAYSQTAANALTAEQKVALVDSVMQSTSKSNNTAANAEATASTVDKWADVGEKLGKSISTVAREAGIAVNEFANSPVGKLSMLLIIYSIVGAKLLHVIGGIATWIIGFILVRYFVNSTREVSITYDETKRNLFGNYPIKSVDKEEVSQDLCVGYWVTTILVFVLGLVVFVTG